MNTMWLLGGLGLGVGLMALLDPEQGAGRREAIRAPVRDVGPQTSGRWGEARPSWGRPAQVARVLPRLPFTPGPGDRLRMQAQGLPSGLWLLGSVGLGVGLGYLLVQPG